MSWITESNRWKHYLYAIPIGAVISALMWILFKDVPLDFWHKFHLLITFPAVCVAALAIGMEFKDWQHGGKFDWIDAMFTELGGLSGSCVIVLVVWLCLG